MTYRPQSLAWHTQAPDTSCQYRHWLKDQGSLTRKIQLRCNAFSVRRVRLSQGHASRDEAKLLGLQPRTRALLREVYLYCNEHPLVFAHSVLPLPGLRGPWRALSVLGNKPLGAALFANPMVKRTPLAFKKLSPRDDLFIRACAMLPFTPKNLWARRSIFNLKGSPILVTEVFLPDILELAI